MPKLDSPRLDRAHKVYVDDWLWDTWGYARGWAARFPEMILWYSAAGAAVLNETAADNFVQKVRTGQRLPARRRDTWRDALALAGQVCGERDTNPVDWFTGGCGDLLTAWESLDAVHGIGPKIASFIMRDLSFMRDYSNGMNGRSVTYSNTFDAWFSKLSVENRALFLPIDVYVHSGARTHGASPVCAKYADVTPIQADADLHRRAAAQIVTWAGKRGFDARDLDTYWYLLGAGKIQQDGTPVDED